jgi:ATP-binding cassette, subfamily B, bacterial MsbA
MGNLWRAFKLVLPHKWMLVWYGLTALGLAVFASTPLILAKTFLDRLQGKTPKDDASIAIHDWLFAHFGDKAQYVVALAGAIALCLVLRAVFDFLNTYIGSWLAQRLRIEAMERVMSHLLVLDEPYHDRHKSGDLISRMVSDGENLRRTVKLFLDFCQQPFKVIALVAVAVYLDWYLFCVACIGVPVLAVPLIRIVRSIAKQSKRYQEKTADLAQAMLQNLAGIRIIHAYGAEKTESRSFGNLTRSLFRTGMRRARARALQRPLTNTIMGLCGVAVLTVGGIRVITQGADPNAFLTFIGALAMLYDPVTAMLLTTGEIAEFLPSAERTFEVLDVKPSIVDQPHAPPCPVLRKQITFEHVSFDYGRGVVFQNFDLTVRVGEKIGIVGRTGVGKSTLLSLVLRFYDPSAGRILIDGVDIRNVSLASLRAQIALVTQNPFLFHATVADNIRYGRPGASDAEVIAAAQAAMIHDEIMAQPEGYETLCGERGGELFSGGQRQRIAVARAILRNAPILLLDEATSALDTFSERRVQEALDRLAVSRTSLIVAHRLSTLSNVDRILVFADSGGIQAVGTHEDLLKTSPAYRNMWQAQSGDSAAAAG